MLRSLFSIRSTGQRFAAFLAFSCAFGETVVLAQSMPSGSGTGSTTTSADAAATTPASLVAARELFRQAGEDADAGRFELALAKFRRVGAVKETAQVRFNIARCEEQLGQIASALADYELAQSEGKTDGSDVGKISEDRAGALRPRVPRITLVAPIPEPPSFVVRLDGAVVASSTFGVPLPVDPGRHRIEASAGGKEPLSREVEIAEKGSLRVPLVLDASTNVSANGSNGAGTTSHGNGQRIGGFVLVGGGVALGVLSVVFTLAHNNKVSDILAECPNGQCPHSAFADASSSKSTASTDAALGVVFGIAGVAALGGGVALVLTAPKDEPTGPTVAIRPGAAGAPAGMSFTGTF